MHLTNIYTSICACQASAWSKADGHPVNGWNHLDNFWRRYNKALLDKLFLDREKERLEKENAALQVCGQSVKRKLGLPLMLTQSPLLHFLLRPL